MKPKNKNQMIPNPFPIEFNDNPTHHKSKGYKTPECPELLHTGEISKGCEVAKLEIVFVKQGHHIHVTIQACGGTKKSRGKIFKQKIIQLQKYITSKPIYELVADKRFKVIIPELQTPSKSNHNIGGIE